MKENAAEEASRAMWRDAVGAGLDKTPLSQTQLDAAALGMMQWVNTMGIVTFFRSGFQNAGPIWL